ncbi:TIGR03086 family metal-binding protein [Nocardioides coralli]|uniref:TIGR03086 family metal-binding protein n=1 Tax=Nocardioides coralli TaxID=2872154 RepID=UPI001CA40479|nr:TIGR03086 family metal-binding protein [Nocardioides coralli]QZY29193.1 TIGR03086 family protein [Nocardioides coralli]
MSPTFTKTVTLPVTPEEAFALVTEPERLRRWHAISARVDLRVGGDYRWTIVPGHTAVGTFREIEPGQRVVLGWGWDGSDDLPADTSTVTITLTPTDGGTELTLSHTGFLTDEQATAHAEGWHHYLGRLEQVAADGDAGADEWAATPREFTEVTAADAALATLQGVAGRLTTDDRDKQTPCADFTCHDLVEHLAASLQQLGAMAGAELSDTPDRAPEPRLADLGMQAVDAWKARGTEGSVTLPSGTELPASFAASILPVELLLHAWDLAQGSGKEIHASDELVAYVAGLAEGVVPGGRGSSFADEVLPDHDAGALDRLAAYAGRTPTPAT